MTTMGAGSRHHHSRPPRRNVVVAVADDLPVERVVLGEAAPLGAGAESCGPRGRQRQCSARYCSFGVSSRVGPGSVRPRPVPSRGSARAAPRACSGGHRPDARSAASRSSRRHHRQRLGGPRLADQGLELAVLRRAQQLLVGRRGLVGRRRRAACRRELALARAPHLPARGHGFSLPVCRPQLFEPRHLLLERAVADGAAAVLQHQAEVEASRASMRPWAASRMSSTSAAFTELEVDGVGQVEKAGDLLLPSPLGGAGSWLAPRGQQPARAGLGLSRKSRLRPMPSASPPRAR